ncbi:MAG: hypothetical protein M9931_11775 [Chitinophagales bacterium]|nr:hypothetical protein [Chitinophagales bacterium]
MALHKVISWNAAARLLSLLFNFLVVLAVSRSLGPILKGETTIWITTIFIGVFASNIVGGLSLVNFLKRNEESSVFTATYIWSLFSCLIFAFIACAFLHRNFAFCLNIFFLTFLSSLFSFHQTALLGKSRFRAFNFVFFLQPFVLWTVLFVLLYLFQYKTFNAFVIALYSSFVASYFISLMMLLKSEKITFSFSFNKFKAMLANGFPFQAAELLQLLHLRLYFFLLAGFNEGGLYNLGIYSVGISILESVWVFPRSVATINFAATAKNPSAANTLRWLRLSLLCSFIALLLIFSVPTELYALVFGDGFLYVKYAVKYLFPGIGLYVIVLVLGSHLMAEEKYKAMSVIHSTGIAVSLLLCRIWIPHYEMSGAGLAATVSFAAAAAMILVYFLKIEKFSLSDLIPKWSDFKF